MATEPLFGVRFEGDLYSGEIVYLKQTELPGRTFYIRTRDFDQICSAIKDLDIRGAPAIAIAGAYAFAVAFRDRHWKIPTSREALAQLANGLCERLLATRPTAVNLRNALERQEAAMRSYLAYSIGGKSEVPESMLGGGIAAALFEEAQRIYAEDADACRRIAEHGAPLLSGSILTHCNTGALATAGIGTAIGCIVEAYRRGQIEHVYATLTAPLFQGARLTEPELRSYGIPVTLVLDSAVAALMTEGKVNAVAVGADRIRRKGQVINKIGTNLIACAASEHDIPFYVAAPMSTFDPLGGDVPIEQRSPDEVRCLNGNRLTTPDAQVYSPAFDITPCERISRYITEDGVFESVRPIFAEIDNRREAA